MAMLAEPRRKQRIGLNPRGKFFQEDEDNRGRQMLMKMGWKNGDGLGAERQGMSEPIKPKVNTDSRGLGFDKTTDPWVAHNEEFELLLKNLNSDGDGTISKPKAVQEDASNSSNEGLEKKSKGSRSRIHYHKFVKNKDLSRASTKDISCIFGKVIDDTADIYTILNSGTTDQQEPTVENEIGSNEGDVNDNLSYSPEEKSKKKKKKKRDNDFIEEQAEESTLDDLTILKLEESFVGGEIKIKKKKKRNKDLNEEPTEESSLDDLTIPKPEEASVEGETKIKKKKKRDKHLSEEAMDEIRPDDSDTNVELTKLVEESVPLNSEISKKKKKKRSKAFEIEQLQEEEESVNMAENSVPFSEQPAPEEEIAEDEDDVKEKKRKKKKSKDKNGEKCIESENLVMTESKVHEIVNISEEQQDEQESEDKLVKKEKKKSKKRKHDNSQEEETTTESHNPGQQSDLVDSEECVNNDPERKKKKKKRKLDLDENETAEQISEPVKMTGDVSSTNTTNPTSSNGDKVENFGSLTFINRGSLHDYFRNKMLSRGLKCSM